MPYAADRRSEIPHCTSFSLNFALTPRSKSLWKVNTH